jgi:ComF family protein
VRAIADALLTALVAAPCIACGAMLDQPTRGPVCAACWQSITPLPLPLCTICGDTLAWWRRVSIPQARCARCRRFPPIIQRAAALGAYQGALRAIIHAMKYDGRRSLAAMLGARMRVELSPLLDGVEVAVPVPLHSSRRRFRGFNQAADLAAALRLPVSKAVWRRRPTPPQSDLPAAQRHRNVRGAFAPTWRARRLSGRIVVLVDDVSTTGATLQACAEVLKTCGAREVRAVTAARVATRAGADRPL